MKPITLPGNLNSLAAIAEYVLAAARSAQLDSKQTYKLRLAVDEIATNTIVHGYQEAGLTGNIEISGHLDDRTLSIYLEDTAAEYDPTQTPPPTDLDTPLEERKTGGLGVYLALKGIDRFEYERSNGKNCHQFTVNRPQTLCDRDRQELEALRREVAILREEKAAIRAQQTLLENWVSMARTSTEGGILKMALQRTLDLAVDLSAAEKGSLFLLEPISGKIVDAILSRSQASPKQQLHLIGRVLDGGLAGWVARHHQLGLVVDTDTDDRWLTLPDEPYSVRSALAIPIVRDNLLGIITLLHPRPGHFTTAIAETLQSTADQIAIVLENARLYNQLEDYANALDRELETGRQIQIDFLPHNIAAPPNWEIAAGFHPAKQVAGDFYDVFPIGDRLGLVVADVCDKGVGAALFMALMRSLIRIFSGRVPLDPAEIDWVDALQAINKTNDYIATNHWQMGMFATVFFGILDPKTGSLNYINAGHEPPFVIGKQEIRRLAATAPAVGLMPDAAFKIARDRLQPGDIFFGYTDGATEAKNPEGKLFGLKRLEALLDRSFCARDLLDRIETAVFDYIDDAPQFDDITLLSVRREV